MPPNPDNARPDEPIDCATWQACLEHDGRRVALVGRYTIERPLAERKGGGDIVRVRIMPEGGRRGAYLEPFWSPDSKRPAEERARLDGRRVRAVGRLHLTAPQAPDQPAHAAQMGGACLHPVEAVELAE